MGNKKVIYVLLILSVIFILIGSTFAYFSAAISSNVIAANSEGFDVIYHAGTPFDGAMKMVADKSKGYITTVDIKITKNVPGITGDILFNVTNISDNLKINGFKWESYKVENETETLQKSGNFSEAKNGGIISLVDNYPLSTTVLVFKIYIWLDGNDPSVPNQNFSDYQEVEFIKNTGVQYIDTGYSPNYNKNIHIEVVSKPTALDARYCLLSNYSTPNHLSLELYNNNKGRAYYSAGTVDVEIGTMSILSKNTYMFDYDSNNKVYTLTFNGASTSGIMNANGTSGASMLLFLDQGKRISTFSTPIEIYGLKISENSVILRNMIPVYRKSNGEIGMFDTVNNAFYQNVGEGEFIKGPDVTS